MKTLKIKCHNGSYEIEQSKFLSQKSILTAAQIDQAIEQSKDEIEALAGDYDVSLEGTTHRGYKIVSRYKGGFFIEGRGKTPRKAVEACHFLKTIFSN